MRALYGMSSPNVRKVLIAQMGRSDARDLANATPEDQRRLRWMHFPAPTADEAASSGLSFRRAAAGEASD